MDEPQPKRSRIHADSHIDYLTNLPENIIENILLELPLKDIVRTTILSSKWIDKWVSIPNLIFEHGNRTESVFIKMVDTVLLSHRGPIHTFQIYFGSACSEAIGRWLLILSKNSIKELELYFAFSVRCKIPFRLVSCIELEHLDLCGCNINIPSYFQGFMKLRTLIISHCDLSKISIENMVSRCPLLDYLELDSVVQQGCIHIRAPNLTYLKIYDEFLDICLETPKLVSAFIEYPDPHQEFSVARDRKESNIIRALGRLSNIQELLIDGAFIQYLATGPIPVSFPDTFNHLTDLVVGNVYNDPNVISAMLCLFHSAPNLEILYIEFMRDDDPDFDVSWESKAMQKHLFKKLKVMEIFYDCDSEVSLQLTKCVLEFARLVLTTAPLLEKLHFMEVEDDVVTADMLKRFPKLSKNVEFIFD